MRWPASTSRLDPRLRHVRPPARRRRRAGDRDLSHDAHVALGRRLSIQTASGDKRTVVVRGIYDPPEIEPMLGSITIGQRAFDAVFPQPKNRFTFIDAGPDANRALTATAADFSDAKVHTGAAFARDYRRGFSSFLNCLYILLAFSVVVSLFGMVNSLVLSVFERTRELGMLRTIGMTRRQARRRRAGSPAVGRR